MLTKEEVKVVKIELILRDMQLMDLAKEIGVCRPTLKNFLSGTYESPKAEKYIRENYLGNREKYGL